VNTFAKLKHISSYRKVEYYSVCLEEDWDDDLSLFELFIRKHERDNFSKLEHIMHWIVEIGDNIGAKRFYFRSEAETADASALPPKGKDREPTYIEFNEETESDENVPNDLRLYCFRASETVVFLFNGDIKTAEKPQDCDNVKPHFRLANRITAVLEIEFNDTIVWNVDQTDIEFEEDLELSI